MTQKNWFNLTVAPSLYCRYAYIDLGEHLADSLFRRQNISVKFEQEFSNRVSPYLSDHLQGPALAPGRIPEGY